MRNKNFLVEFGDVPDHYIADFVEDMTLEGNEIFSGFERIFKLSDQFNDSFQTTHERIRNLSCIPDVSFSILR